MSETLCDRHGMPWKWIPAGISSRTGKPYPAFRRCPDDTCTERPPKPGEAFTSPAPAPRDLPPLKPSTKGSLAQTAINAAVAYYTGQSVGEATVLNFAARIYHQWLEPASEGRAPAPLELEP